MKLTTKEIGDGGEDLVCSYLQKSKFQIIDRNWRTRHCEIDIVAKKQGRIYFVEVKTRKSASYGSGLEYITRSKLKQMSFAAEMWVGANRWSGEYQLAAASVIDGTVTFIADL